MKHLRKFNESATQQDLDELQEFCNDHLSYLIDDDYKISTQHFEILEGDVFQIVVRPPMVVKNYGFMKKETKEIGTPFGNFKDRLIPFIYMLLKEYRLLTNEEIGELKDFSMGMWYLQGSKHDIEILGIGSLDHLEQVEDDLMVKTFFIRVKKK